MELLLSSLVLLIMQLLLLDLKPKSMMRETKSETFKINLIIEQTDLVPLPMLLLILLLTLRLGTIFTKDC